MRLNKVLSLAVMLIAINVQAQDLRIIVDKKGKIGFTDQNGNEVIKCQYESALPFSNGTAIVMKSGKSGIIDATGKVLLPLKYTQILSWNNNLYLVKDGKKAGLVTRQGEIVLPVKYSHISRPNCHGKALIALGGKPTANDKKTYMANAKYGIIDVRGNILVEPIHKGLYEFSYNGENKFPYYEGMRLEYSYHNITDTLLTDCSYLGFSKNGLNIYSAGIIDGNGRELLKMGLYDIVMQPQNNMVRYYITKKKQTICGYHDLGINKGFQATKFEQSIDEIGFWSHGDFTGDIAPVNGNSWAFVDKTGRKIRTDYTSLKHSKITGLWAAKNGAGKWDVFSESNGDVPALSGFSNIIFPVNQEDKEIFTVMKEDKYGCITRSGEIIIPFEYEVALANSFDMVAVKKSGRWGLLAANNTILVPTEYTDVVLPTERNASHFWVKKSDSLYYHFNVKTNQLSSKGYKAVTNFVNGIALVTPPDMNVENTQINRAQLFSPNTLKATIDAVNIEEKTNAFGFLLNTEDVLLMDLPVSTLYKEAVIKEIEILKGRIPSDAEKKDILLRVTQENRSYELNSTLSENEWNY